MSNSSKDFASINQFEAARTGNLAWFQHHKAAGTLPTLLDNANYSLRYAAAHGHLSIIRYLIEESGQPIDVAAQNNYAIRYAARNGHLSVVRYLIEESGQPINITAWDNGALKFATENDHTDVIQYLETVIPIIESLGLDLAREFFKSQLSITSKNTDASSMKGRI
jgi:ankyrin repeat protein